ncbi:MAG: zf-HC2 domain-containing protein [Gemmatimonadales bacterium]
MRHIPEDELHAYLDQGLSRTQCVEIESHLADCPSCQAVRDGIAALRDRTTALLSRLGPPHHQVPPAFDTLRRRAAEAASQRRRRLSVVAWAASLVVAVGLGWSASSLLRAPDALRPGTPVASAGAPAPAGARVVPPTVAAPTGRPASTKPLPSGVGSPGTAVRSPAAVSRADTRPASPGPTVTSAQAPAESADAAARTAAALSVLDPKPAVELSRLEQPDRRGLELNGMWRTMSWDGAKAEAGERVPHIDGLPVVQVQIQNGERDSRPVMVVAQQLSSGQVIRTIEGPATDVSQMLSRRAMADVDSLFLSGDTSARGSEAGHAMAMQRGDRMLAITGDLPSDSLRAMIRRLNAEMRSK